ncbi:MAG: hypothetical protein M1833_005316 [Piccolia ochrophora]|nr:MAG: hypothetical protein M1833_005316 [Piccolia ochrophora]
MVLKLAALESLKLAQLKHLAVQCGVNSTGTKAVLSSLLHQELSSSQDDLPPRVKPRTNAVKSSKQTMPERVLSVDMGIRNLAYCVFDLPTPSSKDHTPSIPSLVAWKRIAITSRPSRSADATLPKESFEPSTYAAHAYTLLSGLLLPHKPSRILIERQRYRSMGSSAVQEWTVRVNMFEGMLHAVLRALAETDQWRGEVESMSPAKVTAFWVGPEAKSVEGGKKGSAKARSKATKINLVGKWLDGGSVVRLGTEEARGTAEAFLGKWRGERRRKVKVKMAKVGEDGEVEGGKEDMGKLDDLADCLLQGVAWTQWRENRRLVLEHGVAATPEQEPS